MVVLPTVLALSSSPLTNRLILWVVELMMSLSTNKSFGGILISMNKSSVM